MTDDVKIPNDRLTIWCLPPEKAWIKIVAVQDGRGRVIKVDLSKMGGRKTVPAIGFGIKPPCPSCEHQSPDPAPFDWAVSGPASGFVLVEWAPGDNAERVSQGYFNITQRSFQ